MSRKVRLLLTSAGGLTGTYLIKHLRESLPEVELLGVDTNRNSPAATWLDHFCVVPRVSEESFESVLREFVESFKPDLMIPVASHDVDYFSEKKDLWPMKMGIMDYAEHVKLHDK